MMNAYPLYLLDRTNQGCNVIIHSGEDPKLAQKKKKQSLCYTLPIILSRSGFTAGPRPPAGAGASVNDDPCCCCGGGGAPAGTKLGGGAPPAKPPPFGGGMNPCGGGGAP